MKTLTLDLTERGKGRPEDQWITMTLGELVALLNGDRCHLDSVGASA